MLKSLPALFMVALTTLIAGPGAAEMRLVMVEQPGCVYCAEWDHEIADIYPLTPEGKAAPLERAQLRGPYPEGVNLDMPPIFTPTFILLNDGTEVGRIEGYPGEDFFWGLLGQMMAATGEFAAPAPAAGG
ncbi:thioredoxin family protein [Ostreiculturibacter nitratireducens]|uniref:thioredoxin family protein n=1 Tax=Ostreiculturibacter nitratireducens TaxID=3075226 RepID=UPI0031B5E0A2